MVFLSISNSIILFLENNSNISRIDDPIDLIRFNDNLIWLFELLISSLDENSEISLKKGIIIVTLVTRDNLRNGRVAQSRTACPLSKNQDRHEMITIDRRP